VIDEDGISFNGSRNIGPYTLWIRIHRHDTFVYGFCIIGKKDRIVQALGHLRISISTNERTVFRDHNFRNGKGLTIEIVEASCDFSRDFDMSFVVFTNWNEMCARKKNIGCLQHWISQKSKGHLLYVRILCHFFETWHAREPRYSY